MKEYPILVFLLKIEFGGSRKNKSIIAELRG